MKILDCAPVGLAASILCLFGLGCRNVSHTSPYHPGPVVGQAAGAGVGVVGGNIIAVPVGFTEGMIAGASAPFDNTARWVRRWHTETTADGRTVQVPQDILVDAYGRPVFTPTPPPAEPAKPLVSPKSE